MCKARRAAWLCLRAPRSSTYNIIRIHMQPSTKKSTGTSEMKNILQMFRDIGMVQAQKLLKQEWGFTTHTFLSAIPISLLHFAQATDIIGYYMAAILHRHK